MSWKVVARGSACRVVVGKMEVVSFRKEAGRILMDSVWESRGTRA